MGKNCKIASILIIILFTSCVNKTHELNFYCDPLSREGHWRFPIFKPYELVVSDLDNGSWNIRCNPCDENNPFFFWTVDSLAYDKGYILLYGQANYIRFHILDLNHQREHNLDKRDQFINFCDSIGLNNHLYSLKDIYNNWKSTKKLPWQNQIPNLEACSEKN